MSYFNGNTPFSGSLNDLLNSWIQLYLNTLYMLNAKSNILDEINKEVSSLSTDEQNILNLLLEYQMAKLAYEAGFMSFIGLKFSLEYVQSQDGKLAAENLLKTIKKAKESITALLKDREKKVNTLLLILEEDPEMRKKLDLKLMEESNK